MLGKNLPLYPNDNIEMGRGGRNNAFGSVLCAFVPTVLAKIVDPFKIKKLSLLHVFLEIFTCHSVVRKMVSDL